MIQQQDRQQQQNEQEMQHEREQQQIRETRKMISAARKGKGKRKKKVRQHSIGSVGENRQRSNDTDFFGRTFGMQMISDRFGDGWHKSVMYMFGRQQIAALFGDGVT